LETLGMKPVGTLTQGDLDGYLSLNAEILEDLKAECNLPAKGLKWESTS